MEIIRLRRDFFRRPTLKVAKELLGKFLVRRINQETLLGRIVETEAYVGEEDKASHAAAGPTKRSLIMYGPPGIAYVYFIYGMHWLLNIVTEEKGTPCAVLIRSLEPVFEPQKKFKLKDLKKMGSGPGRVCRWLKIDGSFNGEDLIKSQRLFVVQKPTNFFGKIVAAKRIGVDYAGSWAEKLWRFYLKDSPLVSQK